MMAGKAMILLEGLSANEVISVTTKEDISNIKFYTSGVGFSALYGRDGSATYQYQSEFHNEDAFNQVKVLMENDGIIDVSYDGFQQYAQAQLSLGQFDQVIYAVEHAGSTDCVMREIERSNGHLGNLFAELKKVRELMSEQKQQINALSIENGKILAMLERVNKLVEANASDGSVSADAIDLDRIVELINVRINGDNEMSNFDGYSRTAVQSFHEISKEEHVKFVTRRNNGNLLEILSPVRINKNDCSWLKVELKVGDLTYCLINQHALTRKQIPTRIGGIQIGILFCQKDDELLSAACIEKRYKSSRGYVLHCDYSLISRFNLVPEFDGFRYVLCGVSEGFVLDQCNGVELLKSSVLIRSDTVSTFIRSLFAKSGEGSSVKKRCLELPEIFNRNGDYNLKLLIGLEYANGSIISNVREYLDTLGSGWCEAFEVFAKQMMKLNALTGDYWSAKDLKQKLDTEIKDESLRSKLRVFEQWHDFAVDYLDRDIGSALNLIKNEPSLGFTRVVKTIMRWKSQDGVWCYHCPNCSYAYPSKILQMVCATIDCTKMFFLASESGPVQFKVIEVHNLERKQPNEQRIMKGGRLCNKERENECWGDARTVLLGRQYAKVRFGTELK